MATNYIPTREPELVTWSNNFDALITASAPTYGLTAAQATEFRSLQNAFVSAYQIARDPSTRTPSAITTKNDAKEAMINGPNGIRELARIVQADPSVTNTLKSDLGLTVRDDEPTPIPPPSTAPTVDVVSRVGRTVTIRMHSATGNGRGKPDGVAGATILSYVGEEPPSELDDWSFEANTGRTSYEVTFPASIPGGSKVWITAFWFNPRKQSGPAASPVSARIGDGLSQAA